MASKPTHPAGSMASAASVARVAGPPAPAAGSGSDAPPTAPVPGRLYGPSSPFNTPIGASPSVAANSDALVRASVLRYTDSANFANSDDWGIAMIDARPSDPTRTVGVTDWGYGKDYAAPAVRIPDAARPTTASDHHLVVFDGDKELDMWGAERQSDGSWDAGGRYVTSRSGSGVAAPVAGNAAGTALAAGVVRPEEIAAGRIDHALTFTSPYVRDTFVAPAVHTDGRQNADDAMPMGTRIQLDPAVDISGLPRYKRLIAQALQEYGAYLVDSSGSLAVRGEASVGRASVGGPTDIWTPVGVTDSSLKEIPWEHIRVITP